MESRDVITIQCVIVLYKQKPDQAKSLSSLLKICRHDPSIADRIAILVQDNSPQSAPPTFEGATPRMEYFHAPTNPGLAAAYNKGMVAAKERKAEWLLLLDQDTTLNHQFLLQLLQGVQSDCSKKICAFVPQLVNNGLILSPQIVRKLFYHRLPIGFSGFSDERVVAFNSAACISVRALTAIGGFPEEYWLDYLDHIVFHKLQTSGGRVYILDSQLEHNLSLQTIESQVSLERYSNVLAAEWQFIKDSGSGVALHRARLLKRSLSHFIQLKNKAYARMTLSYAIRGR